MISEATRARLPDGTGFQIRFLDEIQVKGARAHEGLRGLRRRRGPRAQGVDRRRLESRPTEVHFARRFGEALPVFRAILARHAGDVPARHDVERAERWMRGGVPEDWDGVLTLETT